MMTPNNRMQATAGMAALGSRDGRAPAAPHAER